MPSFLNEGSSLANQGLHLHHIGEHHFLADLFEDSELLTARSPRTSEKTDFSSGLSGQNVVIFLHESRVAYFWEVFHWSLEIHARLKTSVFAFMFSQDMFMTSA